jgi:bacteriorhodopsin
MIKNPAALPIFIVSGIGAFIRGWSEWGLATASLVMAGCLVFIAVVVTLYNRFPRFAAAMESSASYAFVEWLWIVTGVIFLFPALYLIDEGGVGIAFGLALIVFSGSMVRRGLRDRADRRRYRRRSRLFM